MSLYHFRNNNPLSFRLWHWLNALVIFGLLGTVALRKTLLSWRTNSVVIQNKLQETGTIITPELAKDIAVTLRNPLWDWHVYLGYSLVVLFLMRVIVAIWVDKKGLGVEAIQSVQGLKNLPSAQMKEGLYHTAIKINYAIFYLATLIMIITGLLINFKLELNLSKALSELFKEVHEFTMWYFVLFVVAHILGVIIAEQNAEPGIVSRMINGRKK